MSDPYEVIGRVWAASGRREDDLRREMGEMADEIEFLRWKVANREFALRCEGERLSTATRLLREWLEASGETEFSTVGDDTLAFLNLDIPKPTETGGTT